MTSPAIGLDTASQDFVSQLAELYDARRVLYERALARVTDALQAVATDRGIYTVTEQRRIRVESGRVKEFTRLLAKAQLPKYRDKISAPADVFTAITDIAGTRVTCNTAADVRRLEEAVVRSQTLRLSHRVPSDKVREDYISQPKISGYRALHLLVDVEVPSGSVLEVVTCEVQIRTLLQHAWGELTHEDTFKPEIQVPPLVRTLSKRLATALAVLDEIAQDLRDELNKIELEEATPTTVASPDEELAIDITNLRDAFEAIIGRRLGVAPRDLAPLTRRWLERGIRDRESLEGALERVNNEARHVFEAVPVLLADYDLLEAIEWSPAGTAAVRVHLTDVAESRLQSLAKQEEFRGEYQPGRRYVGTALRVTPRYSIVQLPTGQQAIVSARHLETAGGRVNLEEYVRPGDAVRIEVVHVDAREERVEARLLLPNTID